MIKQFGLKAVNVVVLHGSPRKGNTDSIVDLVKVHLSSRAAIDFHDVYLPKDAPVFCHGCFSCFERGEDTCPNARYIQPIAKKIEEADGIIIAAPIYVLQVPGALKAFLDHMAYRFLNHRPAYFGKRAFIISNTAGAGNKSAIKYLRQILHFWGINRITTLGVTLQAGSLIEMKATRRAKALREISWKSDDFFRSLVKSDFSTHPTFLSVILFHIARRLMLSLPENHADRQFWQQQGWLNEPKSFYVKNQLPRWHQTLSGKIAAHFAFK